MMMLAPRSTKQKRGNAKKILKMMRVMSASRQQTIGTRRLLPLLRQYIRGLRRNRDQGYVTELTLKR